MARVMGQESMLAARDDSTVSKSPHVSAGARRRLCQHSRGDRVKASGQEVLVTVRREILVLVHGQGRKLGNGRFHIVHDALHEGYVTIIEWRGHRELVTLGAGLSHPS